MIDPENAFQYSFLMNGLIENAEEIARGDQSADTLGVEAKDDYTLEVRLTQPAPYFYFLDGFPIFLSSKSIGCRKIWTGIWDSQRQNCL